MLDQAILGDHQHLTLSNFLAGSRWKNYVSVGDWEILVDPFWTYPHVYSEMEGCDPQLYAALAQANMLIFKGDLNYRKLVGDINWETTASFKTALQVIFISVCTFIEESG